MPNPPPLILINNFILQEEIIANLTWPKHVSTTPPFNQKSIYYYPNLTWPNQPSKARYPLICLNQTPQF